MTYTARVKEGRSWAAEISANEDVGRKAQKKITPYRTTIWNKPTEGRRSNSSRSIKSVPRGPLCFLTSRSHLKILGDRRLTGGEFQT